MSHPFDREAVPGAPIEALNLSLVQETMESGLNLGRIDTRITDPWTYLERYSGVVRQGDQTILTVAGVFAFTDTPDIWLPSSGVDLGHFQDNPRTTGKKGITALPGPTRARIKQLRGSIFTVIDATVELLVEASTVSVYEGARIVNRLETPINVLRELTTNGVVHRDLGLHGSQVRIQIFPGFIEWISPGRLPPEVFPDDVPLTLEMLLNAQHARNPTLAQFLFHRGYIEKFGFGLDDVVTSLQDQGRDEPEFYNDTHSFRVRVTRPHGETTSTATTREERQHGILQLFSEQPKWRIDAIVQRLGFARSTVKADIKELVDRGVLVNTGKTHASVYQRAADTGEPESR